MGRWHTILKKLLFPGGGWVALAVLLGGVSLALTFLAFGDGSLFAYVSYALSAYALTIFVAAVVPLFSSAWRMVHRIPLARRYLTDAYFKVRSSLVLSLFINLCYAGFKLVCAVWYASFWDGALAVYHVLLCAVRLFLIRRVPADRQKSAMDSELRHYRTTGFFLLLLDLALCVIATQIVMDGQGSDYPGTLIYVAALYAFYSLTLAIVNTVKFRKFHSPVLSAAKAVNLTTALVSIFNLETAMLAQFGGGDEQFRLVMTACTALAVCIIVLTMDFCLLESPEGQKKLALAQTAIQNSNSGAEGMLRHLEPWLLNLIGMVLYGAAAVRLDWRILLVLLAITGANYLIALWAWHFNRRTKPEADVFLQGQHYLRREGETPANGKDIRLYGMQKWLMTAHSACVMGRDKWRRQSFGRRALRSVSDSVFLVARDALAYAMLAGSFLAGNIDAAGFTLTIGIISTFTNWLNEFVATSDDWRYETLEVDDLRDFLEQKDVLNHGSGPDVSQIRRPPRVELRDVTFTYPGQEKPVLHHLSLTIRPGEKIALVGLNGAGKTTLVKLLSGLYKPDSGEILVDGVPTTSFHAVEYLRLVGTLYQDVNILPFTIGENISGREDYDRERVWSCLEQAGLKEAVEALPKGLDTAITQQLDQDGVNLSGGQQQRLLFARALYKDAPLLILDEPTAALDPLAEADLYQKFAQTTGGKTSVFISHRLSSTRFCDRIVYLESGRAAEVGTHKELMDQGGKYAELFRLQSSYYRDEKEERHENA